MDKFTNGHAAELVWRGGKAYFKWKRVIHKELHVEGFEMNDVWVSKSTLLWERVLLLKCLVLKGLGFHYFGLLTHSR